MTHHHAGPSTGRHGAKALLPAGALAALALLAAACGSSSPSATGTTTTSSSGTSATSGTSGATGSSGTTGISGASGASGATGTSGASTTSTSPTASSTTSTLVPVNGNVTQCSTGNLSFALGSSSGSAGAVDVAVVLTNTGSLPCYLYGYPGISAVTGPGGHQIGLAAKRATQLGPPAVVTIKPGQKANADLHVVDALNYPTARCKPVTPGGFRVYPPGNTVAGFVTTNLEVCSLDVAGQLGVGPVVAGASSQLNGATAGQSG